MALIKLYTIHKRRLVQWYVTCYTLQMCKNYVVHFICRLQGLGIILFECGPLVERRTSLSQQTALGRKMIRKS